MTYLLDDCHDADDWLDYYRSCIRERLMGLTWPELEALAYEHCGDDAVDWREGSLDTPSKADWVQLLFDVGPGDDELDAIA